MRYLYLKPTPYLQDKFFELGSGDFTISCWYKLDEKEQKNGVIYSQWDESNQSGFYLKINKEEINFQTFFEFVINRNVLLTENLDVNNFVWNNLIISKEVDMIKLYLNGYERSFLTQPILNEDYYIPSGEFKIGKMGSINEDFAGLFEDDLYSLEDRLIGSIDEFGVWSRPLNKSEVRHLYAKRDPYESSISSISSSSSVSRSSFSSSFSSKSSFSSSESSSISSSISSSSFSSSSSSISSLSSSISSISSSLSSNSSLSSSVSSSSSSSKSSSSSSSESSSSKSSSSSSSMSSASSMNITELKELYNGIIGYWTFDNNINDYSERKINFSAKSRTLTFNSFEREANRLSKKPIVNNQNYLNFEFENPNLFNRDINNFYNSDFTLSFWLKLKEWNFQDKNEKQVIVSKQLANVFPDIGFSVGVENNFVLNKTGKLFFYHVEDFVPSSGIIYNKIYQNDEFNIVDGNWHNVCITKETENKKIEIWINGKNCTETGYGNFSNSIFAHNFYETYAPMYLGKSYITNLNEIQLNNFIESSISSISSKSSYSSSISSESSYSSSSKSSSISSSSSLSSSISSSSSFSSSKSSESSSSSSESSSSSSESSSSSISSSSSRSSSVSSSSSSVSSSSSLSSYSSSHSSNSSYSSSCSSESVLSSVSSSYNFDTFNQIILN